MLKTGRPITVGSKLIMGNRAYVLRLRKACSDALTQGATAFTAEDEDGDDATTTITCSNKLKVKASKQRLGFKK